MTSAWAGSWLWEEENPGVATGPGWRGAGEETWGPSEDLLHHLTLSWRDPA